MATRGFISYVVDGATKTAYNHSDSYPDGLGTTVLGWLRQADEARARELAARLRVVDPSSTPTAEDIERLQQYADTSVASRELTDWYVLLRGTMGRPAAMLAAGYIEDSGEFPRDSLFAEFGYVVDFDTRVFEAYEGFQRTPHSAGRFASLGPIAENREYHPVALVASWSFDSLSTNEELCGAFGDGE